MRGNGKGSVKDVKKVKEVKRVKVVKRVQLSRYPL
jgi:hypothetical protein